MRNPRLTKGFVGLATLMLLPGIGLADTYVLRRDNVIPVVFEQGLTIRDNRPGDSFLVKVRDTDQLPANTEMEGRIDRIHPARGNRPASMDLRFTRLILPDHTSVPIDAAPLPLDDKYITRTGDGRIVAKQDIRKQQADVFGGAVGGFIVGSIFHRRITGTILGTIIGVAAADSDRQSDNNTIVKSGDRMGALFNETVTVSFGPGSLTPPPPLPASPAPNRYGINPNLDRRMADPVRGTGSTPGVSRYSAEYNILLSFKNKPLEFPDDARPYRIGKDVMVPLEPTAKQLGLDIDRRRDRTVYVDGPDINIRLTINSRQARLDGRHIDLTHTVMDLNGVLYVPLDALTPLLKDDVQLNGTKYGTN